MGLRGRRLKRSARVRPGLDRAKCAGALLPRGAPRCPAAFGQRAAAIAARLAVRMGLSMASASLAKATTMSTEVPKAVVVVQLAQMGLSKRRCQRRQLQTQPLHSAIPRRVAAIRPARVRLAEGGRHEGPHGELEEGEEEGEEGEEEPTEERSL